MGEQGSPTENKVPRFSSAHLATSEAGNDFLRGNEGLELTVEEDTGELPTVGYGHQVLPEDGLKAGDKITLEKAEEFYEKDRKKAERIARRLAGDLPLIQNQFDVFVDLSFNVGEGNLSPKKSPKLNAAIKAQDFEEICNQFKYTKDREGKVQPGLVRRSKERCERFRADF